MHCRLLLLSLLLGGCASPLSEARSCFDEARYPEAVAQYDALAPGLGQLSAEELFEYTLYRGLSHLALGDSAPAERWLTLAKRMADASPQLASAEQHHRLLAARRAMGHAPGD